MKTKKARFDTRITTEQKESFEKATHLGGYRSLTHFVVESAEEKAKEIITKKEQILASKRDCEIFFDAITNPGKPNKELQKAAQDYKDLLSR